VAAGLYTATRPPLVAFLVVQILAGYGTGTLESVLNAYLTELPDSTTLLNRLHAFFGVGALLGPSLGASMLNVAPWTAVWLVLGLLGVPLLVGFLIAFREVPPAAAPGAPDRPPAGGLLGPALRNPGVLLAAVLLAVYVGLELGVGNWGFSYLVEARGQGDLLAGYTISGYWLGLTLGRFVLGPLASRAGLTASGLILACLLGVTAAAALTWVLPWPAAAAGGFVVLGFFLGPIFPTTMALVPEVVPARLVPTAIGIVNAASVIGGSALPWLAGAVAQGVGTWTLLPLTVVLALVQVAIWWRLAAQMRSAAMV
jgi:fucose permease